MTGPLAQQFAQVGGWIIPCPSRSIHATGYECPHCAAEDTARAALSEIERHVQDTETARKLLSECLWDDRAWEPDELVARMEQVYVLIGGDLARAALPAREKGTE